MVLWTLHPVQRKSVCCRNKPVMLSLDTHCHATNPLRAIIFFLWRIQCDPVASPVVPLPLHIHLLPQLQAGLQGGSGSAAWSDGSYRFLRSFSSAGRWSSYCRFAAALWSPAKALAGCEELMQAFLAPFPSSFGVSKELLSLSSSVWLLGYPSQANSVALELHKADHLLLWLLFLAKISLSLTWWTEEGVAGDCGWLCVQEQKCVPSFATSCFGSPGKYF